MALYLCLALLVTIKMKSKLANVRCVQQGHHVAQLVEQPAMSVMEDSIKLNAAKSAISDPSSLLRDRRNVFYFQPDTLDGIVKG